MQRRTRTRAAGTAGVLLLTALAWGCTDAQDEVGRSATGASTASEVATGGSDGAATGVAARGGTGADATSAASDGAGAPPLLSTLPVDPTVPLLDYYRDVLKADDTLAACYAAAGSAEGLTSVADLETAEGDPAVSGRLIEAFSACERAG